MQIHTFDKYPGNCLSRKEGHTRRAADIWQMSNLHGGEGEGGRGSINEKMNNNLNYNKPIAPRQ